MFVDVLHRSGISEAASRAALTAMTRAGVLSRTQGGCPDRYSLTASVEDLLHHAAHRVVSADPFTHLGGEWTLFSYSVPETHRSLRHRLRATLTSAGFSGLRDGVWIAPGTVDVTRMLVECGLRDGWGRGEGFIVRPTRPETVGALVRRAWAVDRVRDRHERFLAAWAAPSGAGDPISRLILLVADWVELLGADPGLGGAHLDDWPGRRSAEAFHQQLGQLGPQARRALTLDLDSCTCRDLSPSHRPGRTHATR